MNIRPALFAEHKRLCQIARSHRAGNGFTNGLMFSGPAHYAKGWLRVAISTVPLNSLGGTELPVGTILGFTCVRHKTQTPETKLYYIIIDPAVRKAGVGQALLDDLIATTPHRKIALDCLKDNEPALAFYRKNGFDIVGDSLGGKGFKLEKTW